MRNEETEIRDRMEHGAYAEEAELAAHGEFSNVGLNDVQMFEVRNKGWICGIGRKRLTWPRSVRPQRPGEIRT